MRTVTVPDATLAVHLLGRPRLESPGRDAYRFRSQKSWGLLAYVLLRDRPQTRAHLSSLFFDSADDPMGALRWNLAEVRRGLGADSDVAGDPVTVRLPPGAVVDVHVLGSGQWRRAATLPGLGEGLLEGIAIRGAAGFDSWLQVERRRVAASSEAILHEIALGLMSEGDLEGAVARARAAAAMSPLDENNQALLIRLLRRAGDPTGARDAYDACRRLLDAELGVPPGPAVESAWREESDAHDVATVPSVEAILETGAAAVAAGAGAAGLSALRTGVRLADQTQDPGLRIRSRLVVAETLIHSVRGLDEEGIEALHAADQIAQRQGDRTVMAEARTELGYVDFLRARYARAEVWLTDALSYANGEAATTAKALSYLGSVDSDRGDYPAAMTHLREGVRLAEEAGDRRRAAYGRSMIGRIHLLHSAWDAAATELGRSIALAEEERWLAFLPWPQAMLGEVTLARGDVALALTLLEQAFARACQLGDPCWEGMSARALALVAERRGDVAGAFELLTDARTRGNRLADAYVWLDAHILDAQCTLGRRHGHPDLVTWVAAMQELAGRTDMREMVVRALLHGAALGSAEDAAGARLLGEAIDNPALAELLEAPAEA